MRTMFKKSIRLCLCLNLFLVGAIMAQHSYNTVNNKSADEAWEELNRNYYAVVGSSDSSWKSNDTKMKIDYWSRFEKASNDFRENGLKFWNRFPNDSRKFEWFERTAGDSWLNLNYWKNIEDGVLKYKIERTTSSSYSADIDWEKLKAWENAYQGMRKEYFAYVEAKYKNESERSDIEEKKNNIYVREVEAFLRLSYNTKFRKNKKIDLEKLKQLFIQSSLGINKINWDKPETWKRWYFYLLRPMDNDFLANYKEYGLNVNDMKAFFLSLNDVTDKAIQNWVIQKNSLFALMEDPLKLKYTAIDGREIDLEKLRGKVVLVDFWSVWCTSCVARMPAIKQVYDKYKSKGFEVISACLNNDDKLEQVKGIEKKIGADWPILLIGDTKKESDLGSKLWKKYGFFGVPQLLLLDKNGKLALLNDRLRDGDFEPTIRRLLAEKI